MVRAKHAGAQFQIERTIRRSRSLRGAVRCRRNRQKLEKANATVGSWRLHGEKRKDRARGIPAARLINDQLQQSDKSESCHLAALIQCVLIPENFFHRHKNQGGLAHGGGYGGRRDALADCFPARARARGSLNLAELKAELNSVSLC